MAEGYEPQPTESQISGKLGTCVIKTYITGGTAKTITVSSEVNYPNYFIFGVNVDVFNQTITIANAGILSIFSGHGSASDLNPTKVSNSTMTLDMKAWSNIVIMSSANFTIS